LSVSQLPTETPDLKDTPQYSWLWGQACRHWEQLWDGTGNPALGYRLCLSSKNVNEKPYQELLSLIIENRREGMQPSIIVPHGKDGLIVFVLVGLQESYDSRGLPKVKVEGGVVLLELLHEVSDMTVILFVKWNLAIKDSPELLFSNWVFAFIAFDRDKYHLEIGLRWRVKRLEVFGGHMKIDYIQVVSLGVLIHLLYYTLTR
jgi:hypothetical protein